MYQPDPNRSNFDDVGEFHEQFGLDNVTHHDIGPREVPDDVIEFRFKFMQEELHEFAEACGFEFDHATGEYRRVSSKVDHALAFDALLDLAYVVFGTAHFMGYPWQMGWRLVQRANMAKKRAANVGESKRGHALDVVKPEGWTPPDIARLLKRVGFGTPRHEAGEIDQGGFCNRLVERDGYGDTCGLPKLSPIHTKENK